MSLTLPVSVNDEALPPTDTPLIPVAPDKLPLPTLKVATTALAPASTSVSVIPESAVATSSVTLCGVVALIVGVSFAVVTLRLSVCAPALALAASVRLILMVRAVVEGVSDTER